MSDNDEPEIDPAMAAAMGFTGFGVQPGQKRKYDASANDTFVDPDLAAGTGKGETKARNSGKGANSLPLGARKPGQGTATGLPTATAGGEQAAQSANAGPAGRSPGEASLQELRRGVPNERGDMVYFMPSFLEDPWKDLKAR